MHVLVLNGPSINLLGIREPEIYGRETYADLLRRTKEKAEALGMTVSFYQSNHEGDLVDQIQQAYFKDIDAIILNPAAYTHTSIALLDALRAVALPTVEVHLSDVPSREEYRQVSFVRPACVATVMGKGIAGYEEALEILKKHG